LFSHLANIGDTRSLILHPARPRIPTDRRKRLAAARARRDSVVDRLETAADLIAAWIRLGGR